MQRRAGIAVALVGVGLVGLAAGGGALTGWAGGDPLGCVIESGESVDDVVPIRATCTWPDRSPGRVQAILDDLEGHSDVFSSLGASPVLERAGNTALQRQVHVAPGISDREVVVRWDMSGGPDAKRFAWDIADQQQGIDPDHVAPLIHQGAWEVRSAGTGAVVTYDLRYSPGGSVPYFLVRWFQGAGVRGVLESLHSASA